MHPCLQPKVFTKTYPLILLPYTITIESKSQHEISHFFHVNKNVILVSLSAVHRDKTQWNSRRGESIEELIRVTRFFELLKSFEVCETVVELCETRATVALLHGCQVPQGCHRGATGVPGVPRYPRVNIPDLPWRQGRGASFLISSVPDGADATAPKYC